LNSIINKIKGYFNILFEKYKNDLDICAQTGEMNPVSYLNKIGNEMLKELNKFVYLVEFKNIVNDLGHFDMIHAKTLYDKLDKLYKDSNLNFAILLEKIKILKNYLLKTMLNEDLEEFKEIINKMQIIESNLS